MFVPGSLAVTSNKKDNTIEVLETAVLWMGEHLRAYIKTDSNTPTFEMLTINLGDVINGNYVVYEVKREMKQ